MKENRKINDILIKIYHAGKHMRYFAMEESKIRMKKRAAYKDLYDAIDELATYNKDKRKDD